jgi:hypothetical protein
MKASVATNKDDEIRELRSKLWVARFTIVELMPDPVREILEERYGVESFEDLGKWTHWAIQTLTNLAAQGATVGNDSRLRAICPLCRGGTSSPYLDGYALPLGLSRHLEGSRGSAACPVFKVAYDMTRDDLIEARDHPEARPNWRSAKSRPRAWR